MLDEWDEQRLVKRRTIFGDFDSDQKFEFLCNLAYSLTTNLKTTVFSHDNFVNEYKKICENFSLPESQVKLVTAELESHTGLFFQSGYDKYEFVHKSIQEYLTAEYIVKLPFIPRNESALSTLGAEMAITVSISSNSSVYLSEFVLDVLEKLQLKQEFYDAFVSRLILERPDFHKHWETTISLFSIFTVWLRRGKRGGSIVGRSIQNVTEDDLYKFKKLLESVLTRNDLSLLTKFYEKWGSALEPDRIQYIRKRSKYKDDRLPNVLIFPISFIHGTGINFGNN